MTELSSRREAAHPTLVGGSLREVPGILTLVFPIIIGLTSSTLIGVVDTIMIAPLGTNAMAAAGITTSSLIIMYSAVHGLISVVNIRMAQAKGANNPLAVSSTLRNGIVLALLVGLLGMAIMLAAFPLLRLLNQPPAVMEALLPYWITKSFMLIPTTILTVFKGLFNGINRPWTATVIALLGVVVNIPLNYVLIGGAFGWEGLGLMGAGIASVLANCIALLIAWRYWKQSVTMAPYRQPTHLSLTEIRQGFVEGVPVAIAYTGEGASYALAGLMLGLFGPAALAANQVVHSIAAILYMLPIGMSSAVSIRVGQAIGAQDLGHLRPIGIGASGTMLGWMIIVTILLVFFREHVANALTDDPEVFTIAATMFLATAFMQIADGLQSTSLGALRGMIDVRVPTIISLVAYWLIALPCAYALGVWFDFGPNGVWVGYGLGIFTAAITLQIRFWKKTSTTALTNTLPMESHP